jgi:spermidine synthase
MRSYKWQKLYLAVMSFGFASMAAQILLLRELVVVFYGNELSTGIMLAGWLLWVSIGSLIPNKLLDYVEGKTKLENIEGPLFRAFLVSIGFVVPFTIYLIRNSRDILHLSAGEITGILPMTALSFIVLAPVCLAFGSLFALSCRLAMKDSPRPDEEAGRIYLWEALGAAGGGLFFNFVFVRLFTPFQIALLCGSVTIASALSITDKGRSKARWFAKFLIMAAVLFFAFSGAAKFDFLLRKAQWGQFTLVSSTDSRYGNIALTKLDSQFNLFENGLLVASTNDPLTAESSVHYALLEHPKPKNVLLIGGALTGSLDEVLKHPVENVNCVELDPEMINIAKTHYPKEFLKAFNDSRVKLHLIDARLFVKNRLRDEDRKYDVIILTLPNPFTAQINRFYSLEFFEEAGLILDKGGVFSFCLNSSENYISPLQGKFLASIYRTLKEAFADVKIVPGDTAVFLASPSSDILTYDYGILIDRYDERGLDLGYINGYYLPDRFSPARIEYLRGIVEKSAPADINRDFRPIGYFYDMVLWSSQYSPAAREYLIKLGNLGKKTPGLILLMIFIILLTLQLSAPRLKNLGIVLSLGATGLSGMLLQIAVILAFQVIYGYVYFNIGIIFASYMSGLVLGSALAVRVLKTAENPINIYRLSQFLLAVYSFLLPFIFFLISLFCRGGGFASDAGKAILSILPGLAGLAGGLQFPLATKICMGRRTSGARIAGLLYGVDLFGACAGALFTSAVIIPLLGINYACYFTGLLNTLVLVLIFLRRD